MMTIVVLAPPIPYLLRWEMKKVVTQEVQNKAFNFVSHTFQLLFIKEKFSSDYSTLIKSKGT